MRQLRLRRQLLTAESDLNRAELAGDWQKVAENARLISGRARSIGSLAFAAASFVTGLVSFRRAKSASPPQKLSAWQILLKGTQLAVSLWSVFGPRPKA